MTAEFNWYLNKQGPRGQQGPQGEQGFSPVITVETDTPAAYILRIQTQNDTFLTSNLRGTVQDLGGTYVRYNRETDTMYAGSADAANTELAGIVRLASAQDISELAQDVAVTPSDVNNMVDSSSTIADLQNQININKNNINTIQGNYVTTNTTQTISGNKTFTGADYEFTQQNGRAIFRGRVQAINIQEPYHGSNLIDYGEQGPTRIITLGSTQDKVVIRPALKVQKSGTEYDVISSNDVASVGKAGIVKPDGSTITVDADGTIHGASTYELPIASKTTLGGIKVGDNLTITDDGVLNATGGGELPDNVVTSDNLASQPVIVRLQEAITDSNELVAGNGISIVDDTTNKTTTISITTQLLTIIQDLQARVAALETEINGGKA